MPRTGSAPLISTVAGDFVQADLWTFELAAGTQRWTSADADVVIGGTTWSAGGPVVERGAVRCVSGIEVSPLDVTLKGAFTIGGTRIAALAAAGSFDNVKVTLERLYLPTWSTTPDADHKLLLFVGHVYDPDPSSTQVKLVVKSILAKAEEELPRRTVGPMCPWPWANAADGRCGIVKATWQASDTVAAGSTAQSIVLTTGTSTFLVAGAIILFASGDERSIRTWTAGTKTALLDSPLAAVPGTGSAVTISRGCDKTMATCNTTYANLVRFGGFPFIPKRD